MKVAVGRRCKTKVRGRDGRARRVRGECKEEKK